jgi:Crinkler effector protein N-terminal domain
MTSYAISCFLSRDRHSFPVTIAATETVYGMKQLILERRSEHLRGVDADDLNVYKVRHSGCLSLILIQM